MKSIYSKKIVPVSLLAFFCLAISFPTAAQVGISISSTSSSMGKLDAELGLLEGDLLELRFENSTTSRETDPAVQNPMEKSKPDSTAKSGERSPLPSKKSSSGKKDGNVPKETTFPLAKEQKPEIENEELFPLEKIPLEESGSTTATATLPRDTNASASSSQASDLEHSLGSGSRAAATSSASSTPSFVSSSSGGSLGANVYASHKGPDRTTLTILGGIGVICMITGTILTTYPSSGKKVFGSYVRGR